MRRRQLLTNVLPAAWEWMAPWGSVILGCLGLADGAMVPA
jgi:hypothetical protein